MSVGITIRDDIHERMKNEKGETRSFSDVIEDLYLRLAFYEAEINNLQETTVTQEGRISKTLAGKTIIYKIKENNDEPKEPELS